MLKASLGGLGKGPMASKAWWTPPLVISITSLTASVCEASMGVGGSEFHGQVALRGRGVDGDDPAGAGDRRAVDRRKSDVPPQPITATVSPGRTFEVWIAAPTPVVTEQPIRAARSSGMSRRIATQACSWINICSAKDDGFRYCSIGPFAVVSRGSSSLSRLVSGETHGLMWPVEAELAVTAEGREAGDHAVVAGLHGADFRSPPARRSRRLSCPSTAGSGWG